MPSLKYRSASTEPLAPLGFGFHKLDGVRFRLYRGIAFREGMLALPYRFLKLSDAWRLSSSNDGNFSAIIHFIVIMIRQPITLTDNQPTAACGMPQNPTM